jgi:polyadenylate-binding protein
MVVFLLIFTAERAMDTMNFDLLEGSQIRITWSQRDPIVRNSNLASVFIGNLCTSVTNKDLYDLFRTFGTVLSCKVGIDEEKKSKGFGFVRFATEAEAKKAIDNLNGVLLNEKELYVGWDKERQKEKEVRKKST